MNTGPSLDTISDWFKQIMEILLFYVPFATKYIYVTHFQ